MNRTIFVSDLTFKRLKEIAEPFVDTSPEAVILKLLAFYDSSTSKPFVEIPKATNIQIGQRESRQRGISIKIDKEIISATSVSDLYEKVLMFLDEKGYMHKLRDYLPIPTSRLRFLASATPEHPNGNEFVVPIMHNGIYMEAHKDYKNGINHLEKMLALLGLTLEIQG